MNEDWLAEEGFDQDRKLMEHETTPASIIWYPIFDEFGGNRTVEALLAVTVRWDSFFLANLPNEAHGVICVLSNPCGQSFTFEIVGEDVQSLGPGDLHDPAYEDHVLSQTMEAFGSSWTGIPLNTGYCQWRVDVYPSAQMQVSFYNNTPMYYVLGVVAIFIFAGSLVMLYDFLVERRQRHLTDTATKSNAIVSSLFPEVVRDRLFDNGGAASGVKKYMAESALDNNALFDAPTSAPIADLFPNCTVMFGDIAGFTAWSSAREPSQVFTLLETVYGVFDKLAKKQGVFKVETIGDCYLAVTGLPDPQVDHAVRSK